MAYQLRLLGRFQLLSPAGDGITISSKKNQALIARLALAGGEALPRGKITALLWSDRGEDQARSSLRQAFTALRKVLSPAGRIPLKIDEDQASIDLDAVTVDTQQFIDCARDGTPEGRARAEELWGGEFLDGLSLRDGVIEEWLLAERQRFQTLLIDVLSMRASDLEDGGHHEAALETAQRLLNVDPLHEPAHRVIMRCHALAGDRSKALKQYQACRELLDAELAIAPDKQTRLLHEAIREAEPAVIPEPAEIPARPVQAAGTGKPTLAVLPFDNLSDSETERHFADGVTRELITELGRFSTLNLAAAATMFTYEGKRVSADDIGRELGAAYVLEGSIQKSGGSIRVTAQLTAADSGTQIWADRFDLGERDQLAAQDQITRRISSNLYQPLLTYGFRRAERGSATNASAYDLYMGAMQLIDKPTRPGVRRARENCRKALEADPSFALVYEILMWTYLHEAWNGWTADPQVALQAARREAARGVTVDERDAYLRGSLGFVDVLLGNAKGGLERLRSAIDLVPSDHIYHTLMGGALSFAGEAEKALAMLERADRLSPGYHVIRLFQGDANYLMGDFERAISAYETFLDVLPEFNWALAHLAACHVELDRIEPAREIVERIRAQSEYMTQDYLRRLLLKRDPAVVERLVKALDKAGLPRNDGSAPSEKPSVAVLPFENLSGDPAQQYFADGITENIITDLSRFHDLFVIASNSTFAYKGRAVKLQEVSRELGVRYILEGSVQRANGRVRITAQLVDGLSGRHLWAERYDRQEEDMFAVQDEVTEMIVGTLASGYGGRLRKAWQRRAERKWTENIEAFDCFMRGLDSFNFTKEETRRAGELFEEAIRLDPGHAKAYAKLAWVHIIDAAYGWSEDYDGSMAKGLEFATKAIESDDDDSWAHWALAGYYWYMTRHDLAFPEFEKAMESNPNDADVLTDVGFCLSYAGRAEEGLESAHKAMRLNPHYPEWYLMQLGQIYFDARRYEEAVATFERLHSLETMNIHLYSAASHAALGHAGEARKAIAQALEFDPQATLQKWTDVKMAPYGDPKDLEHFRENLRKAGLPDRPEPAHCGGIAAEGS